MSDPRLLEPAGPADADIDAKLRLRPRDFATIAAVWGFFALVAIASRVLDPRIPGLAPQISAAAIRLTLLEYGLWMLLTPPLLWFAARLTEDDRRRLWSVLLAVVAGLVLALAVDTVVEAFRENVLPPPRRRRRMMARGGFAPFRRAFGDLGFVDDLMVYFAVLFAGVARASMLRATWRRHEAARLQAHASQLQGQLANARLGALRAQLDPHFLFNTLNAVSAMVERDPRGVRRMISRLSELLRHSLEGGADEIALHRELGLLDRYLDIMRVRFGDRLRVSVDASDEAQRALVPNLILQPIVENAIRYAVAPREQGGSIRITAHRAGERLVVRVHDDGPGPDAPTAPSGQGVGLRNARARLAELYGGAQHLQLKANADGPGAVVEISLPYRPGPT